MSNNLRPIGEYPQMAMPLQGDEQEYTDCTETTYYVNAMIHGAATGLAMKLVGSKHAQIVTPIIMSYTIISNFEVE